MIKLDDKFTEQFQPGEQLAMLRLLLEASDDGLVNISYRTFAKRCGLSLQVCRNILSGLARKGELEIVSNKTGTFAIILKYENYRTGKKKTLRPTTTNAVGVLQAKCRERKKVFENSLVPFVVSRGGIYQPQMIRAFFNYWTEKNKSGTKMRFEMEKTWETAKRLKTWENNEKEYGKRNSNNRASATDKAASRNAFESIADAVLAEH